MSHYCCKRCGQRYDDCTCVPLASPAMELTQPQKEELLLPKQSRIRPITPAKAIEAKSQAIPPEVFQVFDELIVRNLDLDGQAKVDQDEAVTMISNKLKIHRAAVFANKWMDVEEAYRQAGWTVEYDKPAYYEDFSAYYMFMTP